MFRRVLWVQLLIGWLPLWVLFSLMIMTAHGGRFHHAMLLGLRMIVCAGALGLVVQQIAARYPWPRKVDITFVIAHVGFAVAYAIALILLNSIVESALQLRLVLALGPSLSAFFLTGVWVYIMMAGVSYTMLATEATARAEGNAAKAQLAALRAQLHPHFLFNALHTVVQLIPHEPSRAASAAEQLAELLRFTIEEDRDVVSLSDECAFVERYLSLERMRFGERLNVTMDVEDAARSCPVPVFALQTLVENAVRHGAAPREEPTSVVVRARVDATRLVLTVHDDGAGSQTTSAGKGTGLKRLRERLLALYGGDASLQTESRIAGGYAATLALPLEQGDA